MGVSYLDGPRFIIAILAEAYKIISYLFSGVVSVHGDIDSLGLHSVYSDVVFLVRQNEFCKMTFICGIVVGANLLNMINGIKRKLQHWGKK